MKNRVITMLIWIIIISLFPFYSYGIEDLSPKLNNSSKFKIAYCENEPYFNYTGTLYGIIKGLYELGWIKTLNGLPYVPGDEDSEKIWKWLCTNDVSDYIEFVDEGFIRLIDIEHEDRNYIINEKLKNNKVDLLISMGTKAGKYTRDNVNNTPIMVFSSSNALRAKKIASIEDSGKDNIWAHMDPDRYNRQLKVFYDLFKFKRLGIVYENTNIGKTLSAIDTVKEFAHENNIQLVEGFVAEAKSDDDILRYEKELKEAYDKISKETDAFYLTVGSRNVKDTHMYLDPFYKNKIPVFSQVGPTEVKEGALLSVYRYNYDGIGRFGADRIIQVLKGAKPRYLSQVYGDTPSISLNLEVADKIDYKIPFQVLLISDIIYKKIAD
jgi:ABC-type uncharacterized transport system substrate-binding protein